MRLTSWDIADGPGITALGLAAARAVESNTPDRLISDPYADAFLDAAPIELPMLTRWPEPGSGVPDQAALHLHGSRYIGVRTRFYDDHLLEMARAGIRQAVILGAGLDTRAYRLDLPASFRIFELDQAGVLGFKETVLSQRSAEPRCVRAAFGVDLRGDWPATLREHGFDSDAATAWVAEGLLAYLPAAAERRMFERIDGLSANGSSIALDRLADGLDGDGGARLRRLSERSGIAMDQLMSVEPRSDVSGWLAARSWAVEEQSAERVAAQYGRSLDDPFRDPSAPATSGDTEPPWLKTLFLIARRPASALS